jgi:hypothetical protein
MCIYEETSFTGFPGFGTIITSAVFQLAGYILQPEGCIIKVRKFFNGLPRELLHDDTRY